MKIYMSFLLIFCSMAIKGSEKGPSSALVYFNVVKVVDHYSGDKLLVEMAMKTSKQVADRMGHSFVHYWQPIEGTKFIDITQGVIDEMSKLNRDKK